MGTLVRFISEVNVWNEEDMTAFSGELVRKRDMTYNLLNQIERFRQAVCCECAHTSSWGV